MAKLAPKMLQSYMAKAKEDADLPDYDEEEVDVDAGSVSRPQLRKRKQELDGRSLEGGQDHAVT